MEKGRKPLRSYRDLDVYRLAFANAMSIFELTKSFPKEERYALVDQIRRSSRSVCANIAEAWQKRMYPAAFVSRLSDSLTEISETEVWIDFASACGYLNPQVSIGLLEHCQHITAMLVRMIRAPRRWSIPLPGGSKDPTPAT